MYITALNPVKHHDPYIAKGYDPCDPCPLIHIQKCQVVLYPLVN